MKFQLSPSRDHLELPRLTEIPTVKNAIDLYEQSVEALFFDALVRHNFGVAPDPATILGKYHLVVERDGTRHFCYIPGGLKPGEEFDRKTILATVKPLFKIQPADERGIPI